MAANHKDLSFYNDQRRIISISTDIDNESMGVIQFGLLYMIHDDDEKEETTKNFVRKPIHLYINSRGGSVGDVWGVIEVILNSKTPVYTYALGYAHSSAFLLFISGAKRYIGPRAHMVCHQISCTHSGKILDVNDSIEESNLVDRHVREFIAERTKIEPGKICEVWDRKEDWYIHPEEAIQLGVADYIYGK